MEDLLNAGANCRRNLKHENFKSSFGRLPHEDFQKACRAFIFPHSTDQIIEISSAVSLRFRQIVK